METTLLDLQNGPLRKEVNEKFTGATDEMRSALAHKKLCTRSDTLATQDRSDIRMRRAHGRAYRRLMQNDRNEPDPILGE
jgi:hypothetical protein